MGMFHEYELTIVYLKHTLHGIVQCNMNCVLCRRLKGITAFVEWALAMAEYFLKWPLGSLYGLAGEAHMFKLAG